MQSITNKTISVINSCLDKNKDKIHHCINNMVDQIIKESMKIVMKNPKSKNLNKKLIKDLVRDSLTKCYKHDSSSSSKKILKCIEDNISPVIDMAVDIMSELI